MDVVLTCKVNFNDDLLDEKIFHLQQTISSITDTDCTVLKVEPWNSIKVTFSIPKKAAKQLKELARSNSVQLKDLDILTVQVEGEEIIKLSSIATASSQPNLHQQSIPLQQNGMQQHMYNNAAASSVSAGNAHLMQPGNPPKKRRKTKEKTGVKANQSVQSRAAINDRTSEQMNATNVLPTSDMLNQSSPQFCITQLSPSVEEIVTEAWDREMHQQNPEEDIMDIQLQSFSSGANVSTGTSQSMINPAFEQPNNMPNVLPKHQHSIPSDTVHVMPPELQKQQSVPSNFAPGHMPIEPKVFSGQNLGNNLATNNMNQMTQESSFFNQQMSMQGGNQEIAQAQQMNNMPANYPVNNNLQASSGNQFANSGQTAQWPPSSNVQQSSSMFKVQAHSGSAGNFPMQQSIPNEISSHVSMTPHAHIRLSQGGVMTSQANMASQSPLMMSHGNVIASQGTMAAQSSFMTSQSSLMTSQGSMVMSPAVSGHHQFPFSFPALKQQGQGVSEMRPDKIQIMGQNMSMDSPMLVNLLQNEQAAAAAASGLPSSTPFQCVAGPDQKPKRKKPTKKKKPSKSSGNSTPTGSAPMQAFGNMYGLHGQFPPQHYPSGEMLSPEPMMQPQMKMSPRDSKVIDAISRSDVGAQSATFNNDGNLPADLHSAGHQQAPMLRRHNSFPVPRSGTFPHGFDPTKVSFPHKPHPNMSPQQQQMYMSQMAGSYPGFKPGHPPRQLMVQAQQQQVGDGGQIQYQAAGYQHGTPPMSMMQQSTRPQRYPVHSRTPPQLHGTGGFSQAMAHPNRGLKPSTTLPTLPQQRPARPPVSQAVIRRAKHVGTLPNGVMSIMLKGMCGATSSDHRMPTFPTLQHAQQQIIRAQSAHARKSPGSSIESMSPKLTHPNTPSPHVQHYMGMPSPSSMGAVHTSGKAGPSQNRPLSRNFQPNNPVMRQASLDQFGNMPQNQPNRPVSNPSVPSPPVTGNIGMVPGPTARKYQPLSMQKSHDPSESHASPRNSQWPGSGLSLASNPAQYFWKGQATVPTLPSSSSAPTHTFVPSSTRSHASNTPPLRSHPVLEKQPSKPPTPAVAAPLTPPTAGTPKPVLFSDGSQEASVTAKDFVASIPPASVPPPNNEQAAITSTVSATTQAV